MMKGIEVKAEYFTTAKDLEGNLIVDIMFKEEDIPSVLCQFSAKDIITHFGEWNLLENMLTKTICDYLHVVGVETKIGEPGKHSLLNREFGIGDYILKIDEHGTLRVTSDNSISIHPKADNAVEIKSTK